MTSGPEGKVEERFDELLAQLRAGRPAPSPALRERVAAIATTESSPEPVRRRTFPWRRTLALGTVSALAAGVVALAVVSVDPGSGEQPAGEREAITLPEANLDRSAPRSSGQESVTRAQKAPSAGRAVAPSALPPTQKRLQDYRADLRVQVRRPGQVASATSRAMRITRSLGGYIVSASYARARQGDSTLVVRVPVDKVQDAIVRFSQLGTLLSQRIEIQDLQGGVNRQSDRIAALRTSIASVEAGLRDPELTAEERTRLTARLGDLRPQLATRLEARAATVRRGRLSRVSLTLTTREAAAAPAPVPPAPPGQFEETLRDAVSVLGKVVGWLLYAVIVASPFLALVLGAALLERWRRRRGDLALLERAS